MNNPLRPEVHVIVASAVFGWPGARTEVVNLFFFLLQYQNKGGLYDYNKMKKCNMMRSSKLLYT